MNDYSQIYDYNLITLRLITQLWSGSFLFISFNGQGHFYLLVLMVMVIFIYQFKWS